MLRECLSSLRRSTSYPRYRVIVIDNQSDDPDFLRFCDEQSAAGRIQVVAYDRPFNYADMHNRVLADLDDTYVVLLNNDVCDFSADWLDQLVATAELSDDIGCVGALLRYPDATVQHGGVTKLCTHAHHNLPHDAPGYCGRLQSLQEMSGVTAALMLVRRDAFVRVGGFDAVRFPVSYNDVDLCLRMKQAGFRTIYNPTVTATHLESHTRGKSSQEDEWRGRLEERWGRYIDSDPFYNPHLSRKRFETDGLECVWREKKKLALHRLASQPS